MSGLVEFLRARLDDDAAEIAKHPDDEMPDWDLVATAETSYPCLPYIAIGKSRVLAEVEAKRRIIEGFTRCQPHDPGFGAMELVVKMLAMPYAVHPDYEEAWLEEGLGL